MSKQYMLTTDEDCHWYVIPADKKDEWAVFCEESSKYWWDLPGDQEPPEQPEWAHMLGGGAQSVKFTEYVIE